MWKLWETMGNIWDMEVLMEKMSRKDMEYIWNLYWKILEHPLNKLRHGGSYNENPRTKWWIFQQAMELIAGGYSLK